MSHRNRDIAGLLQDLHLGSSVAESDDLLEVTRIETSAFTDLWHDRVDLIPGTKGSGKSALFRIFVDFLPEALLDKHKVVVAHGINAPGDNVFHAFKDQFEKLSEQDFVSFWCIYLISLAHEQFIKGKRYSDLLKNANDEIERFRRACAAARIPEIEVRKSLYDILQWTLGVLKRWKPKLTYKFPDGSGELVLDLFGDEQVSSQPTATDESEMRPPIYVNNIKEALEAILDRSQLSLWLMIDRLDEIFPRRSQLEKKALRGLLRAMRYFASDTIRIKVFFRDDMLEHVVNTPDGFTALTHITARKADTLRWTEDQILSMVAKRIFAANDKLARYLDISKDRIKISAAYQADSFYKVFPPTVHKGLKQSPTLRWLYNRCADGRGVVTPRDVLDLLIRAKQKQYDECAADPEGSSDWIIGSSALQYGFEELSKRKKETYLQAEFPHLWEHIEKFIGGKTEYDEGSMRSLLGNDWKPITENLVSIGLFSKTKKGEQSVYSIPFLYRHGLDLTQGKA